MRLSTYTYTNLITTLCVIPPVTLFVIISLFSAFGKGVDKGRGLGRLKPDFFGTTQKSGGGHAKVGVVVQKFHMHFASLAPHF